MKLIPFFVAIALLFAAGIRREWFDLAWASALIVLVGFDGIIASMRCKTDRRA